MQLEVILTEYPGWQHYILRVTDSTQEKTKKWLDHFVALFTTGHEVVWRRHPHVEKSTDFTTDDPAFAGRARFSVCVQETINDPQ